MMLLDVFYSADTSFEADMLLEQYKYDGDDDSTLVLSKKAVGYIFEQGVNRMRVKFGNDDTSVFYERKLYEIIKRTGSMPPGLYKTYITIRQGPAFFYSTYIQEADSLLGPRSPVRKDINKTIGPKRKRHFFTQKAQKITSGAKTSGAGIAFKHAEKKVDKTLRKRGLTSVQHKRGELNYVDMYYEDWFAGRYEVHDKGSLANQIEKMEVKARIRSENAAYDDLSLFSQHRKWNSQKKGDEEISGNIGLSTNMGNVSDPNSLVNSNYSEIRGEVEMPIMGIPFEMEGLYTTQDMNRTIKSSYFRVHYDIRKVKDKLFKSLNTYNSEFAEKRSKSDVANKSFDNVIDKLEDQKKKLLDSLEQDEKNAVVKKTEGVIKDTTKIVSEAENEIDTNEHIRRVEKISKKIVEIDNRIRKYKILQSQYQNENYFDSSLAFAKTKKISDYENVSYKQMAKMGEIVLPDGKAKHVLSGITTADAGMFVRSDSRFTLSSQMLKGASLGYDFGFCEASTTIGKAQYIGRNGELDKFTCYSTKMTFKTSKVSNVNVIYYGYSEDRSVYKKDLFFERVDLSAPNFLDPVHIVAVNYVGKVSRYVTFDGEVATSHRNSDKSTMPKLQMDEKMAYHFSAEGSIPETYVNILVGYDRTGKGFENQTMPMSMAGTEQYKIGAHDQLFRSLLSVGVDFNRLMQHNLSTITTRDKWGFDVRTGFKKYPNISASYKPFTTFRSYSDTLTTPQRPMLGSLFTGKLSYNRKVGRHSWQFSALYSSCLTNADTVRYGNKTMQLNCTHSLSKVSNLVSLCYMEMTGLIKDTSQNSPGKTSLASVITNYNVSQEINVNVGEEVGFASYGMCRYSFSAGVGIRFRKKPYVLRVSARCSSNKLSRDIQWSSIYNGVVDITYRFKSKLR